MAKELTVRKCSFCENSGHNSRTCGGLGSWQKGGGEGLMLFGVRIDGGEVMRKNLSTVDLVFCGEQNMDGQGYTSDGLHHSSANKRHERKKGVPWTEEEHRNSVRVKGAWKGGLEGHFKEVCDYQDSNSNCQSCSEILSQASQQWQEEAQDGSSNSINTKITDAITEASPALPLTTSSEVSDPSGANLMV